MSPSRCSSFVKPAAFSASSARAARRPLRQ